MELPAGAIVTARRPSKRLRWRSAVVQELASQSTHTHVKLKFEGESRVHLLPWSHVQLLRTEIVRAFEPPTEPTRTPAVAAADVIDLETSPFSIADEVGNEVGGGGDEGEINIEGVGVGGQGDGEKREERDSGEVDLLHMMREWLTEKKEPLEKVEARKRGEAAKRLEAARREERRKKEEERKRIERERLSTGGASSVFSFAHYVGQARNGSAAYGRTNSVYEKEEVPQKRKQIPADCTLDGKEQVGKFSNTLWEGNGGGEGNHENLKRRRTSVELGDALYSLAHEQRRPCSNVNERHPKQSTTDDFSYRIPRKGGYRSHASGATQVPPIRISLQPRADTRADISDHRQQSDEVQWQDLPASMGGNPLYASRVRRPPASRVAKQFEASNSPFGEDLVFDDEDSKVLSLCSELATAVDIGEISKKLADTRLQNAIAMRGRGRKSQTPKRWCNSHALRVREVPVRQKSRPSVRRDITDNDCSTAAVANNSLTNSKDTQRLTSIPKARDVPVIVQCICNSDYLPNNDVQNAIQCLICGLWSHLMCTQQFQNVVGTEDDFRRRFMCIQCLEKTTILTRIPMTLLDDEALESESDEVGAVQTVRNVSPLIVQVRPLPQILQEFEEYDKRRRPTKSKNSSAKRVKTAFFGRSPLTKKEVIARTQNVEELRSGVCKRSVGEREQNMVSMLMKNTQNSMRVKAHMLSHRTRRDLVNVSRIALNRT